MADETPSIPYAAARAAIDVTLPDRLYHYTSPEGLIGILGGRSLRASFISALNDTSELNHAIGIMQPLLAARLAETSSEQLQNYVRGMMQLEQALEDTDDRKIDECVFVASVTEAGDLLSQWRAYCPADAGYSIGILSSHLQKAAHDQGYILAKCIYDEEHQRQLIAEIVDRHWQMFHDDNGPAANIILKSFHHDIHRYGPLVKHPSFQEEAEWRLISPVMDAGSPGIDFRPGKYFVVPYHTFSLATENARWEDRNAAHVVIGPTRNPETSQRLLETFMWARVRRGSKSQFEGATRISTIPYRSL